MASANPVEDVDNQDATVEIAPNGDAVFVVGSNSRRLKVHSLILKNASPVFNAMLGPHFAEGQQLAQPGLAEIELPEDNAEAVEIVFNIFHGRNDKVPEAIDSDQLLSVIVIIDQYDCLAPLKFAVKTWLDYISTTDPMQAWAVAMVAIVLHRQEKFAEATSVLVLNHSGSFLNLTSAQRTHPNLEVQLRVAGESEPSQPLRSEG